MSIIDAHACLGQGMHLQLGVDELLRLMDEADISTAIVCSVDHYLAVHNVEGNDLLLRAAHKHPDRIVGMASANPWFGEKAVQEVRRALGEGLLGLMLHPVYQGFWLSDPIADPLVKAAAEFDVPVYAHTGTAGIAEPFHLAELARRFPSVRFLMGHAGASDYYWDAVRVVEACENVYLESSWNGPGNYQLLEAQGALGRLVFGSGAPEYAPCVEIEILRDTFDDPHVQNRIFSETVRHVFKGRLPT